MLYCLDEGWDFEAVFVDHGTDWPETYSYVRMFSDYIQLLKGCKPITIIKPKENNLYDYCWDHRMVPAIYPRWCTRQFKIKPLFDYYEKPCFQLIGIDAGESKRARISAIDGVENRYPLIEADINRDKCIKIIESEVVYEPFPVPIKSGCYICPFQTVYQWKELRHKHPDLFCKAERLEERNIEYRKSKGKKPMYLSPKKASLRSIVEEDQYKLFEIDEYPPCNCML